MAKSPRLAEVFSESNIPHPSFYDDEAMNRENKSWSEEPDPSYLGVAYAENPLGEIDPKQSVLIADLGPDRLIALDYRVCPQPRVLFLADHWIEVASSIEVLLEKLSPAPFDTQSRYRNRHGLENTE